MSNLPFPIRVLLLWAGCTVGVITVFVMAAAAVGFPYPDQWDDEGRFVAAICGIIFGAVLALVSLEVQD